MKNRGRKPQLAYVFEDEPILLPIKLEDPTRIWGAKEFSFPSGDPISQYVLANMTQIDSFPIPNELSVRCFINNADALRVLENKLKTDPANPELNVLMGNFIRRKGILIKLKNTIKKHWMPTRSSFRL